MMQHLFYLLLSVQFLSVLPAYADSTEPPLRKAGSAEPTLLMDEDCSSNPLYQCTVKKNAKGELEGVQKCTDQYGHHQQIYEANYSHGLLQGKLKCWDQEGVPVVESEYSGGKLNGIKKTIWSKSDQKFKKETSFAGHQKQGLQIVFADHGPHDANNWDFQVKSYLNGEQNGYNLTFKNDKVIAADDCEVKGRRAQPQECQEIPVGKYTAALQAFLHGGTMGKDAAKKASCEGPQEVRGVVEIEQTKVHVLDVFHLEGCKVHGTAFRYHDKVDDKNKLQETPYIRGKREGTQKVYFLSGTLKENVEYAQDLPRRAEIFYQNGKKKSEVKIDYSESQQEIIYHFKNFDDKGALKEEGSSLANERYHVCKACDAKGNPSDAVTDNFHTSLPVGLYKSYKLKDGIESESGSYNPSHKKEGTWSLVMTDGTKKEQDFKDGKLSKEKIYDNSSQIIKTIEYYPDGSVKN